MEVTPMGQVFYRAEADSAVPLGCTCHDRSGSCDWCQVYYNGPIKGEANMKDRIDAMRELARLFFESTTSEADLRNAIGNFMFLLAEESEFLRSEIANIRG